MCNFRLVHLLGLASFLQSLFLRVFSSWLAVLS
jgi:hypothetical protein